MYSTNPHPRALPWAFVFRPFGAEIKSSEKPLEYIIPILSHNHIQYPSFLLHRLPLLLGDEIAMLQEAERVLLHPGVVHDERM